MAYPLPEIFSGCIGCCHGAPHTRLSRCNVVFEIIAIILYFIFLGLVVLISIPVIGVLFILYGVLYVATCGFCFDSKPCRLLEILNNHFNLNRLGNPYLLWDFVGLQCCCCFQPSEIYEYNEFV